MEIPKKILDSWNKVNLRINDFCKGDEQKSFKMLFITDVHIGGNNKIKQLENLNELIKLNTVDLIVNGGDIGLDIGEDEIEAQRVIDVTEKAMEYDIPVFYCKGNHDIKPSIIDNHRLNLKLNKNFINNPSNNKEIILDPVNGGGYGFFIDKKTDTLVLMLNTSENIRGFTLSSAQLKYIINVLQNVKNKNVIIVSHVCINKCGSWTSYGQDIKARCFDVLRGIERDFALKRKGAIDEYAWDFTNSKSRLVCHICGDSHFNNFASDDGYPIAVRQGYGGVDPYEMAKGSTKDPFDENEECNFDILVINSDNEAKIFRVGAGEEIRDIELGR